jgi:hypothetical protein
MPFPPASLRPLQQADAVTETDANSSRFHLSRKAGKNPSRKEGEISLFTKYPLSIQSLTKMNILRHRGLPRLSLSHHSAGKGGDMLRYQIFPEFMHNDDVSGFWILNKPQMYGSVAAAGILLMITSTFLSLFPRVAVSLILGFAIGFAVGMKVKGVSAYLYAVSWIMFWLRRIFVHDTTIYAASMTYDSSVEKQDGGRVVVASAQTSLPRMERL